MAVCKSYGAELAEGAVVSANEDDTETESMDFTPDDEKKLVVSPDGSTGYSKIQDAVNAAEVLGLNHCIKTIL